MQQGPFGEPKPRPVCLMRSRVEGACICEDCLADFETIRDDFASLDDCLLSQHRIVSLKALSLASPAHVTWARTRPDANPTEVCPKELWEPESFLWSCGKRAIRVFNRAASRNLPEVACSNSLR